MKKVVIVHNPRKIFREIFIGNFFNAIIAKWQCTYSSIENILVKFIYVHKYAPSTIVDAI
jgi:hypothetical protein